MKRMLIAIAMMVMPFTASADATSFNEYLAERGIVKENVGGINKTQLTDWDKAWIEFYEIGKRGKEAGIYGGIFWTAASIVGGEGIVSIPVSTLRNASNDDVAVDIIVEAVSAHVTDEIQAIVDDYNDLVEKLDNAKVDEATKAVVLEAAKAEVAEVIADKSSKLLHSHKSNSKNPGIGWSATSEGPSSSSLSIILFEHSEKQEFLTMRFDGPHGWNYYTTVLNQPYYRTVFRKTVETAYEAGYEDGYNDGYADGYSDGYNQGFADGVASVK